jgi:hypothetical protein
MSASASTHWGGEANDESAAVASHLPSHDPLQTAASGSPTFPKYITKFSAASFASRFSFSLHGSGPQRSSAISPFGVLWSRVECCRQLDTFKEHIFISWCKFPIVRSQNNRTPEETCLVRGQTLSLLVCTLDAFWGSNIPPLSPRSSIYEVEENHSCSTSLCLKSCLLF